MKLERLVFQPLLLAKIFVSVFLSLIIYSPAGYALLSNKDNNSNSQSHESDTNGLPDLPDNGTPTGRREGGASRGSCPVLDTNLTAIVPGTKQQGQKSDSTSSLALSTAQNPTFWVYIPKMPQASALGEFVIQDEMGEDIYRQLITLPSKAGIIGVKTPETPEYALALDRKYHWYFRIFCDRSPTQSEYTYVDSWIERVDVEAQLKTNAPKNYRAYIERDIWYDALTNLAILRDREPDNQEYQNDWANLLESIGLKNLASAPILNRQIIK